MSVFTTLLKHFGAQGWWPGETIEEIIIGAVLTQNTNWGNVEKAIDTLRSHDLVSLEKIAKMEEPAIARYIRPAGYFNVKAARLKAVAEFFVANGCLFNNKKLPHHVRDLRSRLLEVHGVGKETADSILLYGFEYPIFVIDAYTRRFMSRHGFIDSPKTDYDTIRALFERELDSDTSLYNEYHALLVMLGKTYCRPRALCGECPLFNRRFFTTLRAFEKMRTVQCT